MFLKRLKEFDFILLLLSFLIIGSGLTTVYSANQTLFYKQCIWVSVGLIGCLAFYLFPLKYLNMFSSIFYVASIFLLIVVRLVGSGPGGTHRWLKLGFFQLQGSEVAKLGTIFLIASFMSNKKFEVKKLRNLIVPIVLCLLPCLLILIEPDLGSSLVFIFLAGFLPFYKGTPWLYLFTLVSPVIAIIAGAHWISLAIYLILMLLILYWRRVPLNEIITIFLINLICGSLTPIVWNHFLKPYQKMRIESFIVPSKDPQGMGWQIKQSKIAIGSGGLLGKGFMQGTQKGFDFLPEAHTDFIFAVVSEEFGFVGCFALLFFFFLLVLKSILIAKASRSNFNRYLAIGIAGIIVFQVIVNTGMAAGVMPVVGVPLPFVSYGGSNMLVSLAMIGLMLNIYAHRYEY
ncbi:MAG: rod shape-determining protein RodA [bacterium]